MIKFFIFVFTILINSHVVGQCNGTQSFTLTPPPVGGTYLPGQVVTMCYTMNGYTQAGTNWIEGFDLTLGPGWASVNHKPHLQIVVVTQQEDNGYGEHR